MAASEEQFLANLGPIERACVDISINLNERGIGGDWLTRPRAEQYAALHEAIGNTPIETSYDYRGTNGTRILTKDEYRNPTGSHYDRVFLETLERYEAEGLIRPGDELRDITSGSGGIALTVLAWLLKYNVRLTVPDELPPNRLRPMEWYGATIVNAGPGYIKQASEHQAAEIEALKADPHWQLSRPADREQRAFAFESSTGQRICYLNHSENRLSPQAFSAIGQEMVEQLPEPPQAVALAIGNWTSIAGIAPVLRRHWPGTKLIGYQGERTDVHDNFGTAVEGIPLRFRDETLLDTIEVVSDTERDMMDENFNTRRPVLEQVGRSSLMGLIVALRTARVSKTGGDVLTVAYDQRVRY